MPDKELTVTYNFRMEGHDAVYGHDAAFYRSIPNHQEEYRSPQTGRQETPRPDLVQMLSVLGTAVLSSSVLATAIKSWLQHNRTKIAVSVGGKSISFEGPNLKKSQAEIEQLISALTKESDATSLEIAALYLK